MVGLAVKGSAGDATVALAALWRRHRGTNIERVVLLERATVAVLLDELDEALRAEAETAAHKLAGSLGTFGFPAASSAALQAETLLRERCRDGRLLAEIVARIRDVIDHTEAQEPAIEEAGPGVGSVWSSARLLLISPDADLATRLGVASTASGAEIVPARDLPTARATLAATRLDAVLVDLDALRQHADWRDVITAQPGATPTFVLTDGDGLDDRLELVRRGIGSILPRSQAAAHTIRYVVDVLAKSMPPALTVLLIEKDPASRQLIEASIEGHGFSVIAIDEPSRAWEALVWLRPDIVLLAVAEPEREGFELCRAVRADPRYQHLPLIVLSPPCGEELVEAALLAGASDCLAKPIGGRELSARVHVHAERARVMNELIDRDEVTGVDNRRAAEREIERIARIALRRGEPLTIALLHIEHLGELGDREGQAVADIVLRQLAQFLRSSFRLEDIVGRWDVEEFILVMCGIDKATGTKRITRLLSDLRSTRLTNGQVEEPVVSFSAGVASLPEDGRTLDSVQRRARAALTRARSIGEHVQPAGTVELGSDTVDVVLVEDDETIADVVVHALELNGYLVRTLTDGALAAKLLGDGTLRARVIVLDVGLPGLDGFGVLQVLRERRVLEGSRVLVLTARASESETLRALGLGAADHVAKPFSVPVLVRRVRTLLEARAA